MAESKKTISVRNPIDMRAAELGEYIAATGATVRAAAVHFGISKSTVHKDVTERLHRTDPALWASVREVLLHNREERHLRGGSATRKKYLLMRSLRSADRRILLDKLHI